MTRISATTIVLSAVIGAGSCADARFLQTDPAGYKDDIDLYTYVHDDPANLLDPTGLSAFVDVANDTEVNITIPIYVMGGDAATGANVALIANNIHSIWTGNFGKYHVTTNVQILTQAAAGNSKIVNTLYVVNGATPNPKFGVSYDATDFRTNTGEDIYISMRDINGVVHDNLKASKGANTPAHECGHCMGLRDVSGNAGGNIMDESSGARVAEGDIAGIISSPVNIVTRHDSRSGSQWDVSNDQITGQRCDGRLGPTKCN